MDSGLEDDRLARASQSSASGRPGSLLLVLLAPAAEPCLNNGLLDDANATTGASSSPPPSHAVLLGPPLDGASEDDRRRRSRLEEAGQPSRALEPAPLLRALAAAEPCLKPGLPEETTPITPASSPEFSAVSAAAAAGLARAAPARSH